MKQLTCPECGGFAWFLDIHFASKIQCWNCWEFFSLERIVDAEKAEK